MDLEDVSGVLGLLHLQILGQLIVELGQELVGDDLSLLFVQAGNEDLLPCCIEGQLLLDQLIRTLPENVPNLVVIIQLNCDSERNGVLGVGEGDVVEDSEGFDELILIGGVAADCSKVHVDFGEVLAVDECLDVLELVDYEEKVDGVVLGVVGDEVGDNAIDHGHQLIVGLAVLQPQLVLPANVACQVTNILVSPIGEVGVGSLEQVVETGPGALLSEDHGED